MSDDNCTSLVNYIGFCSRIPVPRSKQSLAKHNSLGIAMSNELAYIRHIFKTNDGNLPPKPKSYP